MTTQDAAGPPFDIGLGITSRCNLNCAHCYSRSRPQLDMPLSTLSLLLDSIPRIRSINLGTGESCMHPQFHHILRQLIARRIKLSLTSNGSTILWMPDSQLTTLHDVDISLDATVQWENDIFRSRDSYDYAMRAIDRCRALGVEMSIATCITALSFSSIGRMIRFCRQLGTHLRLNVYKPINQSHLTLRYDQFWEAVTILLSEGELISCSEPIVNTILGAATGSGGCPCGKQSLRIGPAGDIRPCVYWPVSDVDLADSGFQAENIFSTTQWQAIRTVPAFCRDCPDVGICGGGCAARRMLSGGIGAPDPYCYRYQNRPKPKLQWKRGEARDLVHAGYLCTFIVG